MQLLQCTSLTLASGSCTKLPNQLAYIAFMQCHMSGGCCRTMYKLLRSTCLHCFCLKMAQKEVDNYTKRLSLLAQGKLTEAAAVTTGGGKAAESAKTFVEAGEGENSNGNMLKGKPVGKAKGVAPAPPLDGNFLDTVQHYRRNVQWLQHPYMPLHPLNTNSNPQFTQLLLEELDGFP